MKLRRILAVLLALALLPGLLPSASADHVHSWRLQATRREPTCTEPGTGVYVCDCGERKTDTIPALGHSWGGWATTQAATCGKAGTQTRTCSRCGKTETKTIPATGAHSFGSWKIIQQTDCLVPGSMSRTCSVCGYTETQSMPAPGHDWGEGVVVKEAGYLEDGEIVYTCGRNPAHTKTETIPKLEAPENTSVMSLLRNGNPGYQTMSNPLPLRITVQPEGGAITRGSGETLAMSVEAAGGEAPYTYEWFREYTGESAWAAFIAMVFAKKNGSIWISASNTTYANLPDFAYYCKVTDSNGKYVYSEKAPVTAALRVKTQPLNTNMYGKDSVTLICEAGDGTPGYSYGWIGPDGSLLDNPDTNDAGNELTVSEPGPYTCWIMDSGGGEIYSDSAVVYSSFPLTVHGISQRTEMLEGETADLEARVGGGVHPLNGVWIRDGIEAAPPAAGTQVKEGVDSYLFPAEAKEFGTYTFRVSDAMGAVASATVEVAYDQLQIAEQPRGGMLSADGNEPVEINVAMAEGTAPFTYYLYQGDEPKEWGEGPGMSGGFKVWEPGEYYIHVEDATGRWADSDWVTVREYSPLRLRVDAPSGISRIGETVTLTAHAEGGVEPYTYLWRYYAEKTDPTFLVGPTDITETGSVHQDTRTGKYQCVVTDSTGAIDINYAFVDYSGTAPVIIRQPESQRLPYQEGAKYYSASLVCKAVSSDQDALEYVWQVKLPSDEGGVWISGTPSSGTLTLDAIAERGSLSWRCMVTNTKTGEYAISSEATTSVELVCENESTYSGKFIHFHLHGGKAPYTVKVYQRRKAIDRGGGDITWTNILYKTITVQDPTDIEVGDWKNHHDFYYQYSAAFQGDYIIQSEMADIYIEVLSADGQKVTSSIVSYVRP